MIDSHDLTLSAQWPAGSDDVAEIFLKVGDKVISRIEDTETQTMRDCFRASALSLAFWFADHWWRLRWETIRDNRAPSVDWRLRHELNSACGGALWPPAMIFSVGSRIAFAPCVGGSMVAGSQRYSPFKLSMVSALRYEQVLDVFFEDVLEHCARAEDGGALKILLAQIAAERQDSELAAWRRLEACLGFDPDAAPDEVIDGLIKLEGVAGEQGVEEAAQAQPGVDAAQALDRAIEATRASGVHADLSLADSLTDLSLSDYASPWEMAQVAAIELRSIIGVPKGWLSHQVFEDMFKARWADLKAATATARALPYGARLSDGTRSKLALQTVKPYDRRFELARQLGDAIWHRDAGFGVVSRTKTDRQKFQRAFANNLLCPFDDLQRLIDLTNPTLEVLQSAARKFGVHPSVVRNQLVYKGYLPFENASEEFEAA
ncbi:hypothetical protein [Alcaligenes sp. SDU_A2]|uniref:hypothetical protein n=1 Tax=Alcaligenes sp. SDU_A2 TaxID=3136634 RepID=UPI00312009DC